MNFIYSSSLYFSLILFSSVENFLSVDLAYSRLLRPRSFLSSEWRVLIKSLYIFISYSRLLHFSWNSFVFSFKNLPYFSLNLSICSVVSLEPLPVQKEKAHQTNRNSFYVGIVKTTWHVSFSLYIMTCYLLVLDFDFAIARANWVALIHVSNYMLVEVWIVFPFILSCFW